MPETPTQTGPGRIEFILLVSTVMMTVAFAIDSMLPAFPAIGKSLRITDENDRSLVITVFLVGYAVIQLFAGTITDRFGRRIPLRIGLMVYAGAAIACALAKDFTLLLAARFVQGLASGMGQIVIRSIVRDRFAGRDMAQVMSLSGMVFMLAPILAPAVGQLVLGIGGWRWIFWFLAIVGLAAWLWAQARIPETLAKESRTLIETAALKASARTVIRDRMSIGYAMAMGFLQAGLIGFLTSIQPIFDHTFGQAEALPLGFAIMAAGMSLASLVNAAIVRRFGMRRIGHAAMMFYTAMAGLHLLLANTIGDELPMFIALQTIMMLGHSLCMGNFSAMAMENMGDVAGMANSLQGTLSNIISLSLGTFVGYSFNGTTVPMYAGYFGFGLMAIVIVYVTEGGRFFVARHAPGKG